MKVTLTFKQPDVVDDAIQDENLSDEDAQAVRCLCKEYIEYGEYIRIEIDTDKQTAEVLTV